MCSIFVVVVSIVHDYLIEAALLGEPGTINLVLQIAVIHHANLLYQFLIMFWCSIVETLDGSEKPQIQQVNIR